ncbi:hypothetical protein WMF30_09070 [Sorangium sp. So ce134]
MAERAPFTAITQGRRTMINEMKAGPQGVDAVQYQGNYTVVNCTGVVIRNVVVAHSCGGSTNKIVAESLVPGQATSPQVLHSQTGSSDSWDISFEMNGETISRSGKQCNYELDDSPEACVITLNAKSFSILTPETSPCLNNHY